MNPQIIILPILNYKVKKTKKLKTLFNTLATKTIKNLFKKLNNLIFNF
jgi:hypothetical protein